MDVVLWLEGARNSIPMGRRRSETKAIFVYSIRHPSSGSLLIVRTFMHRRNKPYAPRIASGSFRIANGACLVYVELSKKESTVSEPIGPTVSLVVSGDL